MHLTPAILSDLATKAGLVILDHAIVTQHVGFHSYDERNYALLPLDIAEFRRVMKGREVDMLTRSYGTDYSGWIDGVKLTATEYEASSCKKVTL